MDLTPISKSGQTAFGGGIPIIRFDASLTSQDTIVEAVEDAGFAFNGRALTPSIISRKNGRPNRNRSTGTFQRRTKRLGLKTAALI